MPAASGLTSQGQIQKRSVPKENRAPQGLDAPSAGQKEAPRRCVEEHLANNANGGREPSQRQKKASSKIEMKLAQEQEARQHRQEQAKRKAIRAQRNAPDTEDEADDEEHLDDEDDQNDNMFTSRTVPTKLTKAGANIQELPLVHASSRIPQLPQEEPRAVSEDYDEEGSLNVSRGRRRYMVPEDDSPSRECSPDTDGPNSRKCRSPSMDSLRDTKVPKQLGSRPKASDYDDVIKECIVGAISEYRCLISTQTPFPDHADETELCRLAWSVACKEMGYDLDLTPRIAKLITNRGSHTRGELKTKARPVVDMFFHFESGQNRKIIQKNRQLAEELKDGYGYAYKVPAAEQENRSGLYQTKLIQQIINVMWFRNRRDEGVRYEEHFRPIRPETIALVLTVIECCIDEWLTGIRTDTAFTFVAYRDIYMEHIRCINDFIAHAKKVKKHGLFENICEKLYNRGRFHAGAQPISQVAIRTIPTAAFEAAIKEYDEDSNTKTDGERGDSN